MGVGCLPSLAGLKGHAAGGVSLSLVVQAQHYVVAEVVHGGDLGRVVPRPLGPNPGGALLAWAQRFSRKASRVRVRLHTANQVLRREPLANLTKS